MEESRQKLEAELSAVTLRLVDEQAAKKELDTAIGRWEQRIKDSMLIATLARRASESQVG